MLTDAELAAFSAPKRYLRPECNGHDLREYDGPMTKGERAVYVAALAMTLAWVYILICIAAWLLS